MASYYPPVGFHFRVVFEGPFGDSDIRFQTVSGLNASIGMNDTIQEGGENRFTHRLPGPPKYDNLVLKRGMLIGSKLLLWFTEAIHAFKFQPTGINVFLLNPDGVPVAAWHFVNAYPVAWKVDNLDAMQNAVLAETIEFAYQYFVQLEIPGVSPETTDVISAIKNKLK
jgi:phage tail-like protein